MALRKTGTVSLLDALAYIELLAALGSAKLERALKILRSVMRRARPTLVPPMS